MFPCWFKWDEISDGFYYNDLTSLIRLKNSVSLSSNSGPSSIAINVRIMPSIFGVSSKPCC
ncbi:hypothetical protein AGR1C_Lc80189 [Agrobacterium fabacearum TT111]|nr:hypothetical protein AGR1C_Lc80189 [Agrobacterium fabacearum TT111]